jgi:hypothetical protein
MARDADANHSTLSNKAAPTINAANVMNPKGRASQPNGARR